MSAAAFDADNYLARPCRQEQKKKEEREQHKWAGLDGSSFGVHTYM